MQKLNFSNYLIESDRSTHVMTFMRANPPTIGHERVVNHVMDLAKNLDAGHSIVLSHSFDGDKNPLTGEQKLRHAKLAFPGANVSTSSPERPNIMNHVSDLYGKGVRNLHVVVGQDRVDQFNKLLNQYKGINGPHGHYGTDMNITVHSAGGRDPDAEGVEGVSGTGQRIHARNNNFEGFRAGAPSRMTDEQAASLMNDIRNAQPPAKPVKPAKKKLKEETVAGGEMVRGFGDVSGNPAVQDNPLQQYIGANALAKDKQNGALMKMMKDSQHNLIGFKEFNPHKNTRDKTLAYYEEDPNGDYLKNRKKK
jgi:hypothetical protein